ncbi:MAG: TylF/MycF family methyltransferase [Acidobacteriota bacterium]
MTTVDTRSLYLELMKRSLIGLTMEDPSLASFQSFEKPTFKVQDFDPRVRENGMDWPGQALSMIGAHRMDNIRSCLETVIADDVPGDLIETGVWRGGATIFMRAILQAYGIVNRIVWVADSFRGVPPPNFEKYPEVPGLDLSRFDALAVSLEKVKTNFERYGLLDQQVRFLKGWFKDTLPQAPIEQLSILRLDGDLYESTIDALSSLYPKLSDGGFVIIDDYFIPACAKAVEDYRLEQKIMDEILRIDDQGVYWRKTSSGRRPQV